MCYLSGSSHEKPRVTELALRGACEKRLAVTALIVKVPITVCGDGPVTR